MAQRIRIILIQNLCIVKVGTAGLRDTRNYPPRRGISTFAVE